MGVSDWFRQRKERQPIPSDVLEVAPPEVLPRRLGKYLLIERAGMGMLGREYVSVVLSKGTRSSPSWPQRDDFLLLTPVAAEIVEASPDYVSMVLNEAQLVLRFSHANLCPIVDIGWIGKTAFVAAGWLSGVRVPKLQAKVEPRQPLPWQVAAHLTSEVCAGLAYLHGFVGNEGEPFHCKHHRIEPWEVALDFEGGIRLANVGTLDPRRHMPAMPSTFVCKHPYLSPEAVEGQEMGLASDIFAAGQLLYETATGSRMFTGKSDLELIGQIRDVDFVAPRKVTPNLPEKIETIIIRATQKDPDERFYHVSDLSAELETLVDRDEGRASLLGLMKEHLWADMEEEQQNVARWHDLARKSWPA
ncbi:protein kinase [Myxococcota bacterium]